MKLSVGTQLGPYVVRALIGVGGMGEVYRARDTKLDRDVALKVLPSTFCADADRVARFRREAQILASLNHPHIAAIYGLHEETSPQLGEPPLQALVLELVDGVTLAERITRGPLPLEEALALARQIAEALDAAHEHGIVHRDLKPANIKVRSDGTVKVLDFGLAKTLEPAAAAAAESLTSPANTQLGVVLGTAAYMSPEQARGLPANKRSDIWAFGCVLYEMLTGTRAFDGENGSDIMAAVLRSEPDWSALPTALPTSVRALLQRCLAKDAARRLRDIGDARLDLEQISGAASPTSVSPRLRFAWGLAGLAAGLVAALGVTQLLRTSDPPPETHVEITTPGTLDSLSVALSPDGRMIVFAAADDSASQLWLRRLDDGTTSRLPGTEFAQYPFWSRDGKSIAFFAAGELRRVDVDGGPRRFLARAVPGAGGDWGPNDDILFAPSLGSGIYRMPASGGPATPVTEVARDEHYAHRFPQFLPDGRSFLFYVRGDEPNRGIYIASLDAPGEPRRLTAADAAGLYVEPGWLLFQQQGVLLARRFDAARGQLAGEPIVIADGLATNEASARAFSAVAGGSVAYATYQTPSRLTWFDRSGRVLATVGTADDYDLLDPEISPDGVHIAATRTRQNNTDVWLFDATRTTRFTLEASAERYPTWSPDGRALLFQSDRDGPADIYIGSANAPGRERPALVSSQRKYPNDWSPDGSILYFGIDPSEPMGASPDLWISSLGADAQTRVWLKTPVTELWGQFSPNGNFVAYHSIEAGQSQEVYVRRFSNPDERWSISTAGGIYPRWSHDGKELYYVAPDRTLMAVSIEENGSDLVRGEPQPLFRPRIVGGGRNVVGLRQQYDVTRDGRFLVNVESDDEPSSSITLLLNWRPR